MRIPHPGRRARIATKVAKGILLILLTFASFLVAIPINAGAASEPSSIMQSRPPESISQDPQIVGAGLVPDFALPQTTVSKVESSFDIKGVVQNSPNNLTLYNSAVVLRLLAGTNPHDELLAPTGKLLSSWSSWRVEAKTSGGWVPLAVESNNFTGQVTNETGAFVTRKTQVGAGLFSGSLEIDYKALASGPLKWDLAFNSATVGNYRFVYEWRNVTVSHEISRVAKQFRSDYGIASYTFSWSDVPGSFPVNNSTVAGRFLLSIGLGDMKKGESRVVDPTLIESSAGGGKLSTDYTFQRKVLFDPKTGFYWLFYYGFNFIYGPSFVGVHYAYYDKFQWHYGFSLPPGLSVTSDSSPEEAYNVNVFSQGETVMVAVGEEYPSGGTQASPWNAVAHVYYSVGSISGGQINWGAVQNFAVWRQCNNGTGTCTMNSYGIRYVSPTIMSNGRLAFAYNYFADGPGTNYCGSPGPTESDVLVMYQEQNGWLSRALFCDNGGTWPLRSVVVPAGPNGQILIIYQLHYTSTGSDILEMYAARFDGLSVPTFERVEPVVPDGQTVQPTIPDGDQFSAVSDTQYNIHIVYEMLDGTVKYATRAGGCLQPCWSYSTDIFSGPVSYPSTTVDSSTDELYIFGVRGTSIIMKSRALGQSWSDRSSIYPANAIAPGGSCVLELGSNFASARDTNASRISLVWTELQGGCSNPMAWLVVYASIPIPSAWSPFASPSDPWDGYGIAPFGQYFSNLDDYVSPSTGMLTVKQKDLDLPGRGLSLEITRVYTEPYTFLNGTAYGYENYPWAPLGDGWQLNFPWFSSQSQPIYIHLWDGEGYRIPASFWRNYYYENHEGEHFSLSYANGIFVLTTKSGVAYQFDAGHKLVKIADQTGTNTIRFTYDSGNRISMLNDTMGRLLFFCYNSSSFLASIEQSSGPCGNPIFVRKVAYEYSGPDLVTVTDPAGRRTMFAYNGVADANISPWLLSTLTYPTGWSTSYRFVSFSQGEATGFRVSAQAVGLIRPTREFDYSYTDDPGDRVAAATVYTLDGNLQYVATTTYAFSFRGMTMNAYDARGFFVRGLQQRFGVHGEITQETFLVTDGKGVAGSFTNTYRYDLWGNLIYSSKTINPSTNSYQESFRAYYNDGLLPSFSAFRETFGQNGGTLPDNLWSVYNGTWLVKNGAYNATNSPYAQPGADQFVWTDLAKPDLSVQASVYINGPVASSDQKVGIFVHYPGTGTHKWALVLRNRPDGSGTFLELLDDGNLYLADGSATQAPQPGAKLSCTITPHAWYTFNMTVHRNDAWGWAGVQGQNTCATVSGTFSSTSPSGSATGFGLYAGGYSALFDNVLVLTVPPSMAYLRFSNSFFSNGVPGQSVHDALAGTAELQTGVGGLPVEAYYGYNAWGGPVQEKRRIDSTPGVPQWLTMGWSYDSFGNPSTFTDARGTITYFGYSSRYIYAYLTNQTQLVGATKITSLYGYTFATGTTLWARDPDLNNVTYQYDILARPTRVSYPTGDFQSYSYNDNANYVDTSNENRWLTRQSYDGLSRLTTIERFYAGAPYSNETYTYNWNDKIVTDNKAGMVYTYQYDTLGRQVSVTRPDGTLVSEAYNDTAPWTKTISEDGAIQCIVYDRLGRQVSVVEEASSNCQSGIVTNYYYEGIGNLDEVRNANLQLTTYAYDNLNRLIRVNYPDGTYETYTYDNDGNILTKTDRNRVQTSYSYDSLNHVTSVTYNGSTVTTDSYSYDPRGNLVQLQSQNATMGYAYDFRNRVREECYAVNTASSGCPQSGGGSVAYGTLITLANRTQVPVQNLKEGMRVLSFNTTTSQYEISTITLLSVVETSDMLVIRTGEPLPLRVDNATLQKLWVKKVDGTIGWLSVTQLRVGDSLFDAISQQWTRVSSIEKAPGGSHVMYDIYNTAPYDYIADRYLDPKKLGPVAGPSATSSGIVSNSYQIGFVYNGENLDTIAYPDGSGVKYSYDPLGRVVNATQQGTTTYYAKFSYFVNDLVSLVTFGNGMVARYTYDAMGRPSQITLTGGTTSYLSLAYTYNSTGTVANVVGSSSASGGSVSINEQYAYDPLQRLVNAVVTSGQVSTSLRYTYDNVGNRMSQTTGASQTSYYYNTTNNELTKALTGSNTVLYGYDANGNLLARNVTSTASHWTYTWNVPGQLLKVANNTSVAGYYAYDGFGRRLESKEASLTTFYAYYGTETLSELISGGSTTNYVYAVGFRIARTTGATVSYYHEDALGSTRLVTDSSKTPKVVFSDNYQPYGQDNGATGGETYKFTGKSYSAATGFYYYFQRWYDPSTGRFISQDLLTGSLGNPQSTNTYVYALNQPTTVVDPSGLASEGLVEDDAYLDVDFAYFWRYVEGGGGEPGFGEYPTSGTGGFTPGADIAPISTSGPIGTEPNTGPGGVRSNQIGDLGVQSSIDNLGGEANVNQQVKVQSDTFGEGKIDLQQKSTGRYIEVKNQQYISRTKFNELQARKYVDAVGSDNLEYRLYTSTPPSERFLQLLDDLGVKYKIFPYIPKD